MNKDHCNLAVKLASAVLLTGVATAEQDDQTYYIDSTDSITLSMRFGLNMSGKFLGTGGSLGSPASGRYVNGYVLPDSNGNALGYDWYWGYSGLRANGSSPQVTGKPGSYQITFDQLSASGIGQNDSLYDPRIGAELTYNHQFGIKENWHHLRYGLEFAFNYTPLAFQNYINASVSDTPYTYSFSPYVTSVPVGYQGTYLGGNSAAVLDVPGVQGATVDYGKFIAQQDYKGDLWGFRLGPYLEMPVSRKLSVHVSGGLAVGLLDGNANWSETLTPTGGNGAPTTTSGGGDDLSVLWGEYARLDFSYQVNRHWSAEIGAQFQNLGTYDHNFGGRIVELDLSQSIFVEAGITYSF